MDSELALLHFVKPLYLKSGAELEKDELFYSAFTPVYEQLQNATRLYDMVRNFATQKPYSTEKIKLNFGCSTLLNGWDVNKETQNLGVLLQKDGKYYLGIMDKANNKTFSEIEPSKEENCYQKVMYKYFKDITTMIPKCSIAMKDVKSHFSLCESDYVLTEKFTSPLVISKEIFDLATITYDGKKKFQIGYYRQTEDKSGYADAVKKWIQFCMDFLRKYISTANYNYDSLYPLEQFTSYDAFIAKANQLLYAITYKPISSDYISSLVAEGKLYLFQIYNKDFSAYSKGKPNLHTMYWNALFSERNLADVIYKLNGEAEVFYRKKSIADSDRIVHPAKTPLDSKNPARQGAKSIFEYDIVKDRRYTVDKFQFHVPVTMNFKAAGTPGFNESVCAYLRNNPDVNIIGIDRGERHLLYISMIDRSGNVVRDKSGKLIQYSLNSITGEYKDAEGNAVPFTTPYRDLLDEKEKAREEARESWGSVESIKELKSGYLSQVVHHIAKLMVDYNAVVVLEDLNSGFKNSRVKVEKQVYQNFEKALIQKLNYLVFKDCDPEQPGGLYHALQLTDEFQSFRNLTKQTGFLFYVPAWNTSKIDPVTGFVDFLKPRYTNINDAKSFFGKFDAIVYDPEKDYFRFSFDYRNFTEKANGTRTGWSVCTFGDLRYSYNRALNNNKGGYEKHDITAEMKALFREFGIDFASGKDLIPAITGQSSAAFFAKLTKLLQITLAMRYSCAEDGKDFILSPVADKNGRFFNSEEAAARGNALPQDADANGAYNIARKGLLVLRSIDASEKYGDWTTKISNHEWLSFAQADHF